MKKEIKINHSYVSGEYLVQFFEEGQLKYWEIATDSKELSVLIRDFYHS